jgi:chromate reductase, NAD(P)H dehydrogenase (quinone)
MSSEPIRILAIAGSLRANSFNKQALEYCKTVLPANATMDIFDLKGIPLFSEDEEYQPVARVSEFKAAIKAADVIFFAVPEYNNAVSGVLKNAIDVGSRPWGDNSWANKVVATISVSIGNFGGVKAQLSLKPVYTFLRLTPVPGELCISDAGNKFKDGKLVDTATGDRLKAYMVDVVTFARKIKAGEKAIQ